ncbi:MAG: transaldolase [Desulfatibacillaceae bacterium]
MTKIHELNKLGQSIWFDYIDRSLLDTGGLARLVDFGVTGVTSNPSIFEKAITSSSDYDTDIAELTAEGLSTREIHDVLVTRDIVRAAHVLWPVYENTRGADGFVSVEVAPCLAHDAEATYREAVRLYRTLDCPNVMIKVPATHAGIVAGTRLIAAGINVNYTLIFSLDHYVQAAESYVSALRQLVNQGPRVPGGLPADMVRSVASVFISRTDSALDPVFSRKRKNDLEGTMAVSIAKTVYSRFLQIFSGPAWESLDRGGAWVQRPLWASTSTKNPDFPDTKYVDELIGPHTVNTLPPQTLDAFLDHGAVADTLAADRDEAEARLQEAAALGVDLSAIMDTLQDDGLHSFAKAHESLLASIGEKRKAFTEQGSRKRASA